MKPSVEFARQAFLYGNGDGVPIGDVEKLAALGSCHENTIRNWLPAWKKEREALVSGSSSLGLSLSLSAETLNQHKTDMQFLRTRIDETLTESKLLPKAISFLESFISEFNKFADPEERMSILAIFQTYLASLGHKKSLDQHFLAMQARWVKLGGVESLLTVAETREKTLATGRAKQLLEKEKAESTGNPGDSALRVQGGVFARRGAEVVEGVPRGTEMEDDGLG